MDNSNESANESDYWTDAQSNWLTLKDGRRVKRLMRFNRDSLGPQKLIRAGLEKKNQFQSHLPLGPSDSKNKPIELRINPFYKPLPVRQIRNKKFKSVTKASSMNHHPSRQQIISKGKNLPSRTVNHSEFLSQDEDLFNGSRPVKVKNIECIGSVSIAKSVDMSVIKIEAATDATNNSDCLAVSSLPPGRLSNRNHTRNFSSVSISQQRKAVTQSDMPSKKLKQAHDLDWLDEVSEDSETYLETDSVSHTEVTKDPAGTSGSLEASSQAPIVDPCDQNPTRNVSSDANSQRREVVTLADMPALENLLSNAKKGVTPSLDAEATPVGVQFDASLSSVISGGANPEAVLHKAAEQLQCILDAAVEMVVVGNGAPAEEQSPCVTGNSMAQRDEPESPSLFSEELNSIEPNFIDPHSRNVSSNCRETAPLVTNIGLTDVNKLSGASSSTVCHGVGPSSFEWLQVVPLKEEQEDVEDFLNFELSESSTDISPDRNQDYLTQIGNEILATVNGYLSDTSTSTVPWNSHPSYSSPTANPVKRESLTDDEDGRRSLHRTRQTEKASTSRPSCYNENVIAAICLDTDDEASPLQNRTVSVGNRLKEQRSTSWSGKQRTEPPRDTEVPPDHGNLECPTALSPSSSSDTYLSSAERVERMKKKKHASGRRLENNVPSRNQDVNTLYKYFESSGRVQDTQHTDSDSESSLEFNPKSSSSFTSRKLLARIETNKSRSEKGVRYLDTCSNSKDHMQSTSKQTSNKSVQPSTSKQTSHKSVQPSTSKQTSNMSVQPSTSEQTSHKSVQPSTSKQTSNKSVQPSTTEQTSHKSVQPSKSKQTSNKSVQRSTSEQTSNKENNSRSNARVHVNKNTNQEAHTSRDQRGRSMERHESVVSDPETSFYETDNSIDESGSDFTLNTSKNNGTTVVNISRPARRGSSYSEKERRNIVAYIVLKNAYSKLKGKTFWEKMESARICPGRTWQSLKEHFLKTIMHNIKRYVTVDELAKLTKGLSKQSRGWSSDGRGSSSQNLYTRQENQALIKYIVQNRRYQHVGGNNMWKKLEERDVLPGRTWQSLRDHYRKVLVHNLTGIDITQQQGAMLRSFCPSPSNT